MPDKDYPYKGRVQTCNIDKSKYIDMKITGYNKLGSSAFTWSPVEEAKLKNFYMKLGL